MSKQDELKIQSNTEDEDANIKLSFPLERSSAMKILGWLWTGYLLGQIIVSALLLIGVLFMGNQKFNMLSVLFFFVFILPFAFLLHRRMVSKGRKLMKGWCDIKYEDNVLYYKSGFPNTMNPDWQKIEIKEIDEEQRKIILKGEEVGGYHIRLSLDETVRFGLWVVFEDANTGARNLSKLIGWPIVNETKTIEK